MTTQRDRLHEILDQHKLNLLVRDVLVQKDHRELCTHQSQERSVDVLAGLISQPANVDLLERRAVLYQVKRQARIHWDGNGYAYNEELETFITNFCRFAVLSAASELGKIVERAARALKPSDPHLITADVLEALSVQKRRPLYARKIWKPMLQRDDVAAFAFRQLLLYSNGDPARAFLDLCQRFVNNDGTRTEGKPDVVWLLALANDRGLGKALVKRLKESTPVLFNQFKRLAANTDAQKFPWVTSVLPLLD